MCEHCGCRGIEPIGELMDEHFELLDHADRVRRLLDRGEDAEAWTRLGVLADLLVRHVAREEAGIFAAVRQQGDFADAVGDLETEHRDLDEAISRLDVRSPMLRGDVESLLSDLAEHIDKENLGLFPVVALTLTGPGWELLAKASRSSR